MGIGVSDLEQLFGILLLVFSHGCSENHVCEGN